MDTVSATAALIAVGLTLSDPLHFFNADRYGGFVVGLIVVSVGVRVARETALQLMDTMPNEGLMNQIRMVASTVPGVRGVEKCFARKTGLRYHVDLHLEVDPEITDGNRTRSPITCGIRFGATRLGGRRAGARGAAP